MLATSWQNNNLPSLLVSEKRHFLSPSSIFPPMKLQLLGTTA